MCFPQGCCWVSDPGTGRSSSVLDDESQYGFVDSPYYARLCLVRYTVYVAGIGILLVPGSSSVHQAPSWSSQTLQLPSTGSLPRLTSQCGELPEPRSSTNHGILGRPQTLTYDLLYSGYSGGSRVMADEPRAAVLLACGGSFPPSSNTDPITGRSRD